MTSPADGPVLVTGASGAVGGWVRPWLRSTGWVVRGLDRVPPVDGDADVRIGDALDPAVLDAAVAGCAALVHLSGIPTEAPFEAIVMANILGAQAVLDAAARLGVRRVVLASSNHAVGMHPRPGDDSPIAVDLRPRPDSFYGVSKVAVEALGQLYADRFGLEVVSLRIGSCRAEPMSVRELSSWLSPDDVGRLVDASLRGPVGGHVVAYGTSANTRGWWDLSTARALGYLPLDDAERFAGVVPPDDADAGLVGGPMAYAPVGV